MASIIEACLIGFVRTAIHEPRSDNALNLEILVNRLTSICSGIEVLWTFKQAPYVSQRAYYDVIDHDSPRFDRLAAHFL